ncbi:hypothetical protein MTR67_026064 [Solanum verrucosum]|uniref:Uncharacterized protein n=1 Tax=Solanum verrucosum TaxID=315347 RepID=A0AAF0TUG0_SOLVR|nr:hypothetical protein MTR67_026064 [Solanum verrucosum]
MGLMELLKDYDVTILSHPRKTNVMVDALSRKARSMGSLAHLEASRCLLVERSAHRLQCLALSILAFWIIGRYSTTSQNLSATGQLLISSPFDPLSLRLRVLERRAVHVVSATRQVKLGDPQDSISCSFHPYLLRFAPKCP